MVDASTTFAALPFGEPEARQAIDRLRLASGRVGEANGAARREVAGTMSAGVPGGIRSPPCASRGSSRTSPARDNIDRRSAGGGRATRHPGHAASRRIRKRIEGAFG
jgi:hypothetical protein